LAVRCACSMVRVRGRSEGSVLGSVGLSLGVALMAASFGLLVAALGNTPASARGVTSFAILILVMLGGAWVPTFIFPAWLQQFTLIVPVRWAVDGFDAMTWRGLGLAGAVMPIVVLVAFAAAFMAIAAARFRWGEADGPRIADCGSGKGDGDGRLLTTCCPPSSNAAWLRSSTISATRCDCCEPGRALPRSRL